MSSHTSAYNPVLKQCVGGWPPTCSGVGSANRKDLRLLLTPLGGQVCTEAELCTQTPQKQGYAKPPGAHTAVGTAGGLSARCLCCSGKDGPSSLFLLPGRACPWLRPNGSGRPWELPALLGCLSGTGDCWSCSDSQGKGAVSHWLVGRLLLPRLTKGS